LYKCFRCGRVYSIKEARENFTECKDCYKCHYCGGDLKIKYANNRYFFECFHCLWSSENQEPIITNPDKLNVIREAGNILQNDRLYEDYAVYCPKCKNTLINTKNKVVNSLASVFPKIMFNTKSIPVNTRIDIFYWVKNTRPEGSFFRLDWEAGNNFQIMQISRAAEFDFHSPFIKSQKTSKLAIKADNTGELNIYADLSYKFDEIKYGAGKTKIKLGPIIVYPRIEITRILESPPTSTRENNVKICVKNEAEQELQRLIVSDMILEGALDFKRRYWDIKNLEKGGELQLAYSFNADPAATRIRFDVLRGKIRFSSFMPQIFFDYEGASEIVEIE